MEILTINDLAVLVEKEIKKGNGAKKIMISRVGTSLEWIVAHIHMAVQQQQAQALQR